MKCRNKDLLVLRNKETIEMWAARTKQNLSEMKWFWGMISKQMSLLKIFKSILILDLMRKLFNFIASRNCVRIGMKSLDREGKTNVPVAGSIHTLTSVRAATFPSKTLSQFPWVIPQWYHWDFDLQQGHYKKSWPNNLGANAHKMSQFKLNRMVNKHWAQSWL